MGIGVSSRAGISQILHVRVCLFGILDENPFALEEMPDLYQQFERGDLLQLREWLRKKIHIHGRRYRATDLCKKVTGKPLDHKPLVAYMKAKYGEIYGF